MSRSPATRRLQIAVRTYIPPQRQRRARARADQANLVLVFDTETTTDPAQRLLFGSYRVYRAGRLLQEGLIAADDLDPTERAILTTYVADHPDDGGGRLRLFGRSDFVAAVLWPIGYEAQARIVGFNLPFDLSRLAIGATTARDGGFSLRLWESVDAEGRHWRHQWRPDIAIKAYAPHRQFIAFTAPAHIDPDNRDHGKPYRGRFLDLHTAAFAYTDRSLGLEAAAREFGLEVGKAPIAGHGVITPAYIDYNRQDVRLTYALYERVAAEHARHPIALPLEQAYSPASISKAYLRTAGIRPLLERPDVPDPRLLGRYMAAYYGGRAEVRIRRTPLPVRYVDATSMYPTVFALQGLWGWLTAARFRTADVTREALEVLATARLERILEPATWPALAGVVCRVRPTGALLPVRARYEGDPTSGRGNPAWTIGLNYLHAEHALWYMLADLLADVLLGGPVPEIDEAIRVAPAGIDPDLRPVRLRGAIAVDPAREDLFRRAIEERARVRGDAGLAPAERERLTQFLKTLANGGAYGIFAEVHQRDAVRRGTAVTAYGLWDLQARVATPEEPGEYCFPPLAASITAAARLLLATLEAQVEAAGGTYVACDTDSLLIVANKDGGLVPCPAGPERLTDGRAAVRALSYAAVDAIRTRLDTLNPYERAAVPTLFKLEPENVGPADPPDEELRAVAISAKRYALYRARGAKRRLVKPSSHGLGLYRPPEHEPDRQAHGGPGWISAVWEGIIAEAEGVEPAPALAGADERPAISQLTVSSPRLLRPFALLNRERPYANQVKPFSFLAVGHVDPMAPLPAGLDRDGLVPVAPYAPDASGAATLAWRSRRTGQPLAVTTDQGGRPDAVRLTTYGDVVAGYRWHPEHKSGDPAGGPGLRSSAGLLPRLTVVAVGAPIHIGKESNRLEEEAGGAIVEPDEVTVEYHDPRAEWQAAFPSLRRLRDERGWRYLAEASGLSERALRYALNGGKVPRGQARDRLVRAATRRADQP